MLRLQGYDISVTYKKSKEMLLADTLSRAYLNRPGEQEDIEHINMLDFVLIRKKGSRSWKMLLTMMRHSKSWNLTSWMVGLMINPAYRWKSPRITVSVMRSQYKMDWSSSETESWYHSAYVQKWSSCSTPHTLELMPAWRELESACIGLEWQETSNSTSPPVKSASRTSLQTNLRVCNHMNFLHGSGKRQV